MQVAEGQHQVGRARRGDFVLGRRRRQRGRDRLCRTGRGAAAACCDSVSTVFLAYSPEAGSMQRRVQLAAGPAAAARGFRCTSRRRATLRPPSCPGGCRRTAMSLWDGGRGRARDFPRTRCSAGEDGIQRGRRRRIGGGRRRATGQKGRAQASNDGATGRRTATSFHLLATCGVAKIVESRLAAANQNRPCAAPHARSAAHDQYDRRRFSFGSPACAGPPRAVVTSGRSGAAGGLRARGLRLHAAGDRPCRIHSCVEWRSAHRWRTFPRSRSRAGRPVSRSFTSFTDCTVPCFSNRERTSVSVALKGRLPT